MARRWQRFDSPSAAVVVGVAAAAVAWWRLGSVARGTVWAEDGGVFLRERVAGGPWDLLVPYAGYLHVLPRIVVDLAWLLPVERYAVGVSGLCCLVAGIVSALVFLLSADVVRPLPLRFLLAAVPVVLPLAPFEISGTAANLHWYVLVLAPWLYTHRARSWWTAGALAVVALLGALTEPQAAFFVPLLLVVWLDRRPIRPPSRRPSRAPNRAPGRPLGRAPDSAPGARRRWTTLLERTPDGHVDLRALPVTLAVLLGSAAQAATVLTQQRGSQPGTVRAADVAAGYLLQPLAGAWDRRIGAVVGTVVAHGWWVVAVPAALVAAVLVTAVVLGRGRVRWVVVALSVGSVLVWSAELVVNGTVTQAWATLGPGVASVPPQRYAAAAGLLLVSAVVVAASVLVAAGRDVRSVQPVRPEGPSGGRLAEPTSVGSARWPGWLPGGAARFGTAAVGWCVVAVVVVAAVANAGPGPSRRSFGPVWAGQVPAATAACRADPALGAVPLTTAPWRPTSPWRAAVPCERLIGRR